MVAEKMGAVAPGALAIEVTPSSFTATPGAPPVEGAVLSALSVVPGTGDGTAVTYTENAGGDPGLKIVSTGSTTADVEGTGTDTAGSGPFTTTFMGTRT
jgi:hypothetical protein